MHGLTTTLNMIESIYHQIEPNFVKVHVDSNEEPFPVVYFMTAWRQPELLSDVLDS